MTGLDHTTDVILSISCYITDATLNLLEPSGYHAVIATPKSVLDNMSPWCIDTHGRTGLTSACLKSTTTMDVAATSLLAYIKHHVHDPRVALLAGNSVHVDKLFLLQSPWTEIVEYLHYRILDVSAIKESLRRWCSESVLMEAPQKKLVHSAREDVLESIEEARYYMSLFQKLGGH